MLHQLAWGGFIKVANNDFSKKLGKEVTPDKKKLSVSLSIIRFAYLERRRK